MALPTLSKNNVTTLTLSRGSTFPSSRPLVLNQVTGVSDNNTIRVFSLGPPRQTLELIFEQLTQSDIDGIVSFFDNPLVNWGVNSFTYTDEDGVGHITRFLQTELAPQEVAPNNYSLSMVFTKV